MELCKAGPSSTSEPDEKLLIKECLPIDNFEHLISWNSNQCPYISKLISPLEDHYFFDGQKVLLCHDMKGGYLEDRFIQGSDNYQAYRFFHWTKIDTFIYFSHHFITIPPITWINAAHINGVQVLGTIITEGSIGRELCEKMLQSDEMINTVCEKLVSIAVHYYMEGWFINIENEIDPTLVPKLLYFVKTLHRLIKASIPRGQVLWYDSVTIDGSLKWQNCLNNQNLEFFKCCDGIFLNYTWKDADLQNSLVLASALGRPNDVFVGIDVFGRGMFGDGGHNTVLAVEKIKSYSLSKAIFAPGWVLETLGPDNFTNNQINFWRELRLPIRHCPKKAPIYTNFCQGFGLSRFRDGFKINDKPWFNLNAVMVTTRNYVEDEVYLQDAFNGGHSIRLAEWFEPIFVCHIDLTLDLVINLVFKITSIKDDIIEPSLVIVIQKPDRCGDCYSLCLLPNSIKNLGSGWTLNTYNLPMKTGIKLVLTKVSIKALELKDEQKFLVGSLSIDKTPPDPPPIKLRRTSM